MTTSTTHPDLFTLNEAAARLRISKAQVCRIVNGVVPGLAPLPALRLGRRKLIRRETLERWMGSVEGVPEV